MFSFIGIFQLSMEKMMMVIDHVVVKDGQLPRLVRHWDLEPTLIRHRLPSTPPISSRPKLQITRSCFLHQRPIQHPLRIDMLLQKCGADTCGARMFLPPRVTHFVKCVR